MPGAFVKSFTTLAAVKQFTVLSWIFYQCVPTKFA